METYHVNIPSSPRVPILVSVPHCGTVFPEEIKEDFIAELIKAPDDTDWFVDRLYSFAPSLGITMISAALSRWVIDLNRDPDSKPLYTDGRIITALCPATTFLGEPLYRDGRKEVALEEVLRRKELYFQPYHQKVEELLAKMKSEFGKVLLWDCHSIRQVVPTIQKKRFPDLILGSADGQSAANEFIQTALRRLGSDNYSLEHNHPFKGGYITRHYGRPGNRQHALQLEMTKINYMDDAQFEYHPSRADKIGRLLRATLKELGESLIIHKD
ncbi:MAG TPA: N-formylglutamate amidohydrolase [Chryseosolibacter sp.]|nr:N-formylglutamate amidohydrolase [Chryseosolibacter sp.]